LEIPEKEDDDDDEPLPGLQDLIAQFFVGRCFANHPVEFYPWSAPYLDFPEDD
jgi:hypothetical protein